MIPERTEVLIVGAGPAGLALAVALRQAGVEPVLVERRLEPQGASRAAVIHAHTMEALDAIGVGGDLAARGMKLERFAVRERDRRLLGLRFDRLPGPHPYILMVSQEATEAALAERLAALGGSALRGVEATAAVETPDGVRVTLEGPEGRREILAGRVVAADGMRSRMREAAGIAFEGASEAESFVLADVRMDWPLGREEVALFFADDGMMVVAPLPGGVFRIVAMLDDPPEAPDVAQMQAIVDARGPSGRAVVREVIWGSRFRIHHRLAARYRAGRFLLVGDAAHVHSPAGGQGMNTGIVDAVVLGRTLAEVVSGRRPEDWLDRYGVLRRPAAERVLALAGRLTALATARSRPARALRDVALAAADALPPARRRIEMALSGLSRRDLAPLAA